MNIGLDIRRESQTCQLALNVPEGEMNLLGPQFPPMWNEGIVVEALRSGSGFPTASLHSTCQE